MCAAWVGLQRLVYYFSCIRVRFSRRNFCCVCFAMLVSWVTIITVVLCSSQSDFSRVMIFVAFSSSKFPVGSSAKISFGLLARARAMATRCCSPPESLLTVRSYFSLVSCTLASSSMARCFLFFEGILANSSGSVTFSSAVKLGIRLYCWNMNPMSLRR